MRTAAAKAASGLLGVFALILIAAALNFLNMGVMTAAGTLVIFLVLSIVFLVLARSGKPWTYAASTVLGVAFVALGAVYASTGVMVIQADQLWLFIMSQVVAMLVALQNYLAYAEAAGPKAP